LDYRCRTTFLAGAGQLWLGLHLLEQLEDLYPAVHDEKDEGEGDEAEELEEVILQDGHQDGGHQGRSHSHHVQHQPVHQVPSAKIKTSHTMSISVPQNVITMLKKFVFNSTTMVYCYVTEQK